MAILNGPFASKSRGRAGEVVFAKTTGNRTAMRSYQPKVKNPKTKRQVAARTKFSQLSAVVAALAPVLNIGYAKAASGSKMYPRNMALRDYYYDRETFTTQQGSIVMVDMPGLKVSRKIDLNVPFTVTLAAATGTNPGSLTVTADASAASLQPSQRLGVVVAFVHAGTNDLPDSCIVKTGLANTEIPISVAESVKIAGFNVFVFLKVIEPSGTDVSMEDYPWKYPSATSETQYAGEYNPQ